MRPWGKNKDRPGTATLLREHLKAQRKAKMAAPPGAWQGNDLVFCQPDGRPWLPTT